MIRPLSTALFHWTNWRHKRRQSAERRKLEREIALRRKAHRPTRECSKALSRLVHDELRKEYGR